MQKFLLVTDLDNTLVGDDEAMAVLTQQLSQHRAEYGTRIVYSTGRSFTSYQQLRTEKQLLEPDALVTAVGTEIYFGTDKQIPNSQWSEKLSPGWNRELAVATAAHFPDLVPQPNSEQRPFKVSYFVSQQTSKAIIPQLESLLAEQGLAFKVVYSGGKDLDILPECGDKGLAMRFLRQTWDFPPSQTVACGDSGNDIALFSVGEERGIIVGNALPELRQWYETHPADYRYFARASYAGGVLEGLRHFGFL